MCDILFYFVLQPFCVGFLFSFFLLWRLLGLAENSFFQWTRVIQWS